MTFLELAKRRRSIRKYSPQPLPREAIDRCIEAARLAPSACNSQPWHFIIIDDNDLKEKVAHSAFSGAYSMNSFAKEAPVLVAVVTERSTYFARLGGYFKGTQYSLIDIGIACEHFILQAEEEGIGTCWLGWFNEGEVKKTLGVPKDKKIDIIVSMGYPQDGEAREKKRKALEEIRTYR